MSQTQQDHPSDSEVDQSINQSINHRHFAWAQLTSDSFESNSENPVRRYGHSACHWPEYNLMIATHGYYYDWDRKRAEWLSDTWAFSINQSISQPINQWSLIHDHCQDDSQCPKARFGTSAVIHQSALYLTQGDDGGNQSINQSINQPSYRSSLLSDVWKLQLSWPVNQSINRWTRISTVYQPINHLDAHMTGAHLSNMLIPRGHHTSVLISQSINQSDNESTKQLVDQSINQSVDQSVDQSVSQSINQSINVILSFGGMVYNNEKEIVASNDLLLIDLDRQLWSPIKCSINPSVRFGHSMTVIQSINQKQSINQDQSISQSESVNENQSVNQNQSINQFRVFIYGGFVKDGADRDDLWTLLLDTDWLIDRRFECSWKELSSSQSINQYQSINHQSISQSINPIGRGYSSLVVSSMKTHLLMIDGAHCEIGCKCLSETWSFDLSINQWFQLIDFHSNQPMGRYKHTAVALNTGTNQSISQILLFGGESYLPQRYHSDVWLLSFDPVNEIINQSIIPAYLLDLIVLFGLFIGLMVFVFVSRRLKPRKLKI